MPETAYELMIGIRRDSIWEDGSGLLVGFEGLKGSRRDSICEKFWARERRQRVLYSTVGGKMEVDKRRRLCGRSWCRPANLRRETEKRDILGYCSQFYF